MATCPEIIIHSTTLLRAHVKNWKMDNRLLFVTVVGAMLLVNAVIYTYTSLSTSSSTMQQIKLTLREEGGADIIVEPERNISSMREKSAMEDSRDNHTPSSWRLCIETHYQDALSESLDVLAQRAYAWLTKLPDHRVEAQNDTAYREHNHARFFPFDTSMATCQSKDCVGGPCQSDLSKIVCGLTELQKKEQDECIIYSIGGNNQWDFELDLLQKTPCEVHTFDCTGLPTRFEKPTHDRLHFHHVCLGIKHEDAIAPEACRRVQKKCGATWTLLEMQQQLGHDRIDLLKIDIEGWEWPLLQSWPLLIEEGDMSRQVVVLPMQILMEVHYRTPFKVLRTRKVRWNKDFKFAIDMVELQARLLQMGYVVVARNDNESCRQCTELTLLRHRCPPKATANATLIMPSQKQL